ncbi:MAG: phosphoribosylglycinamide synthetase C domain-containing protein, partial [Pseudomonadota bacterium]
VLMMRLQSDIADALYATATGGLDALELKWCDEPALTVVMAAEGYPGTPAKGGEIDLSGIGGDDDVVVFHAGTAESDGRLVANGGRVLAVTARGHSFSDVQAKAYSAAADVRWDDGFYRRDIGYRAIERERRDD